MFGYSVKPIIFSLLNVFLPSGLKSKIHQKTRKYINVANMKIFIFMMMMIGGIMEMMFSNFWSAEKIVYPHFTSQQTALLASILIIIIVITTNIALWEHFRV